MKRFYMLLIAILSVLVFTPNKTLALSNFVADNTVNVHEDYNDNAFFAGNIVNIDSYINGLAFAAGNTVTIKGSSDYTFAAGQNVTVDSVKTKDAFVAGNVINVNNSDLRNIYAAASSITINANAAAVYAAGDTIELNGDFENANIAGNKVKINGKINGVLTINDDAEVTYGDKGSANEVKQYKGSDKNIDQESVIAGLIGLTIAAIIAKILSFVNHLLIGFILIALFKKTVKTIEKLDTKFGFSAARFGFGFVTLVFMPVASIILLITGILSALGVIGLVLYGLFLYLASIVAAFYIGRALFPNMNNYLRYFLALLFISILRLIPIVGGLVGFVVLCLGLGLIVHLIFKEIKGK